MKEGRTAASRLANPNDARAVRSRAALRAAFLELIDENQLEEITIRAIASRAGVSYPVFFRNYGGKEEILADIATQQVQELLNHTIPLFYKNGETNSVSALCEFINERRPLWKSLLNGGAAAAMRMEFIRIAAKAADQHVRANHWLPTELAGPFVSSGLFEILAWWLRMPEDYPLKNVVTLIEVLIVNTTGRPQNVILE